MLEMQIGISTANEAQNDLLCGRVEKWIMHAKMKMKNVAPLLDLLLYKY